MRDWKRASPKAKKYLLAYQRKRHNLKKIEGIKILGGCCAICGEEDAAKLQFHHKNPEQRSFRSSKFSTISWKKFLEEIKKCGLLCQTHHTILHQEGPEFLGLTNDWLVGFVEMEDIDEDWDSIF